MKPIIKALSLFTILLAAASACQFKGPDDMTDEELVMELSERKEYEKLLNYAKSVGLDSAKYAYKEGGAPIYGLLEEIAFGHKPSYIKYMVKANEPDSARIRNVVRSLVKGDPIEEVMASLEPQAMSYQRLKQHYQRLRTENKRDSAAIVANSLNAYRWMNRQANGAERMVLVNIRGAYLKGIDSTGKDALNMRVIAGKKDTPTPSMDTYATQVITYPYWNVPQSIATKEILPKVKNDVSFLERNKFEVIDSKGERIDPYEIDWSGMGESDFPYRFRQDTGEDNSLGLLKVDIENPHAIYLHDTNARYLFTKDQRWRSHGCVRVQHPADLANFMAGEQLLENDFLQDPKEDHPPKHHKLNKKVPVFLLYLGADVNEAGQLVYFEDVYGWERRPTI
ncbi:L,D-transpeptidase family protein [Telluribacter humicola]|uniref:L,D-transpeptidase family protein n=1 Tax=Telluribacter humicola TaxID=1720261 RepID=UPI001A962BB0|nr:L,D-transpeptidase family protein [Telluribacter humicola]